MNKFLAEAAGALNIFLALALVVLGGSLGKGAGAMGRGDDGTGIIIGALGGVLLAVLVCGGLAILIAIRDEVRLMRGQLAAVTGVGGAMANASPASESTSPPPHTPSTSPSTVRFEGKDVVLQTVNQRSFAVLDDGRVLLKTRSGDLKVFESMQDAEAYTGARMS